MSEIPSEMPRVTEDEAAAQAQLREIVKGLSTFVLTLEGVLHLLPVPPEADAMHQGETPMNVALAVRTVIECGLHDHLRPFIQDLQSAAFYRPPATSTDQLTDWRIATIDRLLDKGSAPLEEGETQEEICPSVWNPESAAEAVELSHQRRQAAESLLSELMQASAVGRLKLLDRAPFQSRDLLDRLLEESHAVQLADPARAVELARLAARLASALRGESHEPSAELSRALLLGANARRLEFRLKAADSLLTQAAGQFLNLSERAYFCQTAALLRWAQGRYQEAEALLLHACYLYAFSEGQAREAGACLMLLGLLLQEAHGPEDTLPLLLRGWVAMDRDRRPHLALRGGLALATELGRMEKPERAREVFRDTHPFFTQVTDPAEKLRVHWWQGRALASLGHGEDALPILDEAFHRLLAEQSLAEAALVSLDFVLACSAAGRIEELGVLAGELESAFPKSRALALAAERIGLSASLAQQGDPRLREVVSESAVLLCRTFRTSGLRIKPLLMA